PPMHAKVSASCRISSRSPHGTRPRGSDACRDQGAINQAKAAKHSQITSVPMLNLPGHSRYAYSPIVKRPDYAWPQGRRLAFYVALNIEHFAFGTGIGMDPVRSGMQTTRNWAWR